MFVKDQLRNQITKTAPICLTFTLKCIKAMKNHRKPYFFLHRAIKCPYFGIFNESICSVIRKDRSILKDIKAEIQCSG